GTAASPCCMKPMRERADRCPAGRMRTALRRRHVVPSPEPFASRRNLVQWRPCTIVAPHMPEVQIPPEIAAWFDARGWRVRRHQADMLSASEAGRHALLVADTGAGKTLAGFLPTLADFCPSRLAGAAPPEGLHTLYVSPLKALAHDVQRNLLAPVEEMRLPLRIETRSGDTPADRKRRQRGRPPHILLTTPESLSLLLSYPESFAMFAGLKRVVIDEVHAF